MKYILSPVFALGMALSAFADLPENVIVGTEEVPSAKFAVWSEADASAYSGEYAGDVAGDTAGKLEINIKKTDADLFPYRADGTYHKEVAGQKPTAVQFNNGNFSSEERPVVRAGPVEVFFVTYEGKNGVVIEGAFISKQ